MPTTVSVFIERLGEPTWAKRFDSQDDNSDTARLNGLFVRAMAVAQGLPEPEEGDLNALSVAPALEALRFENVLRKEG